MNENGNGVSWMHRFATFLAVMAFLLIVFGALVTSANATLPIPRWPRLFGIAPPASAGGAVKYEGDFVMLVRIVSLSALILAAWLWRSRAPRHVKVLAGIMVLALLALAALGGLPVFFHRPVALAVAYSFSTQTFFCLTVCLALFTRTDWRWGLPKIPDLTSPSLRQVLAFTSTAIFLQSIAGAAFRERRSGIALHFLGGIVITLCALWVVEMALAKFSFVAELKIPAIVLTETVVIQLFLGIVVYSMQLNAGLPRRQQAPPGLVVMSTTHNAIGSLVLVSSLFATFQAFKYLTRRAKAAEIAPSPQKTVV